MIDVERFESVLDGLSSTINDIEDKTLRSELYGLLDALYDIYEDGGIRVKSENDVMRTLLAQLLSDEQKRRLKWKYNIDVDDGVTGHEYII